MTDLRALDPDPIHNPELTDEQRAALADLSREQRIALGQAIGDAILAQLDDLIEGRRRVARDPDAA